MLKSIDPILNADVLYALRAMGHTLVTPMGQTSANSIAATKDGWLGAPDPRTRGAEAALLGERREGAARGGVLRGRVAEVGLPCPVERGARATLPAGELRPVRRLHPGPRALAVG